MLHFLLNILVAFLVHTEFAQALTAPSPATTTPITADNAHQLVTFFTFQSDQPNINDLAFSQQEHFLAVVETGSADQNFENGHGFVRVWNTTDWTEVGQLKEEDYSVISVSRWSKVRQL